MKPGTQSIGKDPEAHRGTIHALGRALGYVAAKPNALLIDQAADADFLSMIDRLRGEPVSKGGKK